jgi:hypothetical protein
MGNEVKTIHIPVAGFIIFFLTQYVVLAQQNGFIQVYTSFEKEATAALVVETNDGYKIAGYGEQYFILKTDKKGNPLGLARISKNISISTPYLTDFYTPIIRTHDNGFIMIDVDSIYNYSFFGLKLIKVDSTDNILWRKTIEHSVSFKKYNLLESHDGSVYVSLQHDSANARLIKTDKDGSFLWGKDFHLYPLTIYGMQIREFSDKNVLLAGLHDIKIIDGSGNILNEAHLITIAVRSLLITRSDEIVFATGDSRLVKTDRSGNIIWSKDINAPLYSISETYDGGIAGLIPDMPGSHLFRFDINGDSVWNRYIQTYIQYAGQSADGGYLLTGYHYYTNFRTNGIYGVPLPVFIRTDSEGGYTAAALSFPLNPVRASWEYEIEWFSNNVPYLDIDFSTDNGSNWIGLTRSLSTEERSFIWTVPFDFSDKCLLRIQDSDDPSISDQSDSAFSIVPPYNKYDNVSVNEVKMWIGNNGDGSHDPYTEGQGFYWPGGENASIGAVFEDGLVWGGKVNGEIRTGGSTYRSGLQPGNVLPDGSPADSGDQDLQVWRIRKYWQDLPPGVERDMNEYNYNHWPVETGIPWIDANSDGVYTPGIDRPEIYGDEMLFNVANDFDTTTSRFLYGSDPIGVEMQCITFAKDTSTALKDAVFKKYKLINKSNEVIKDMYLSYWTDDDMGDATDDFIGVDTSLNLGYTWNATNNDALYGTPPPSIGHMIIQGPRIAASTNDSARFENSWIKGYVNLDLTAFGANFKNALSWSHDPPLGIYEGTVELYNLIRGLYNSGSYLINPFTNEPTVFALNGDPVSGVGWYEGDGWPGTHPQPGDRRFYISSGPFNLAPGDTQEIVIAIFMAKGSDNVQSIAALREKVPVLLDYYNNELVKELKTTVPAPLTEYYLSQNYPNPFNSTTNIEYTIPQKSVVTIKIYDILGREVRTINRGEQVPWHYKVSFNASALASGVYFYRIEAVPANDQSGNFVQTKKMVLLK